jgi:hypothetical protein
MKITLTVIAFCTLLFCCKEKTDTSKAVGDINHLISTKTTGGNFESDKALIIEAVDRSYDLIEIAEIAQLKGSQLTSSQATAVKDGQIAILYHLIDYADMKAIELPETNSHNEAVKDLYSDSEDFEKKWHREVSEQNEAMINTFENFRSTDKNLTKLTGEILNTLRFNRTVLDDYIAESTSK